MNLHFPTFELTLCHFYHQVFVKEFQTVEKYTNNATVIVTVEDRNDNSPRFVRPFYEITVQEELPRGTNVLQVLTN